MFQGAGLTDIDKTMSECNHTNVQPKSERKALPLVVWLPVEMHALNPFLKIFMELLVYLLFQFVSMLIWLMLFQNVETAVMFSILLARITDPN